MDELAIEAEGDSESSDDEEDIDDNGKPKVERSMVKTKKQKSIFKSLYDMFGIDSVVNNIQGRAAVVFNYMRGLALQKYRVPDMYRKSEKYIAYLYYS